MAVSNGGDGKSGTLPSLARVHDGTLSAFAILAGTALCDTFIFIHCATIRRFSRATAEFWTLSSHTFLHTYLGAF